MKYFISHSKSLKKSLAIPLQQKLTNIGIECWIDRKNIITGMNIYDSICEAINKNNFCIALINKEFLLKNWTKEELTLFHEIEEENSFFLILPVYCELSKEEVYDVFPWLHSRAFEIVNSCKQLSSLEENELFVRIVNHYFSVALDSNKNDKELPLLSTNLLANNKNEWIDFYNTLVKTKNYISQNYSASIVELCNINTCVLNILVNFNKQYDSIVDICNRFLISQKSIVFNSPNICTYNAYIACFRATLYSSLYLERIINFIKNP